MAFKDPERRREYFRKYMKERRNRKTQAEALNLIKLEVATENFSPGVQKCTSETAYEKSRPDTESVTFKSFYRQITYRIPGEEPLFARFEDGRFATEDERVIAYLRGHRDFGVTLTEGNNFQYGPDKT